MLPPLLIPMFRHLRISSFSMWCFFFLLTASKDCWWKKVKAVVPQSVLAKQVDNSPNQVPNNDGDKPGQEDEDPGRSNDPLLPDNPPLPGSPQGPNSPNTNNSSPPDEDTGTRVLNEEELDMYACTKVFYGVLRKVGSHFLAIQSSKNIKQSIVNQAILKVLRENGYRPGNAGDILDGLYRANLAAGRRNEGSPSKRHKRRTSTSKAKPWIAEHREFLRKLEALFQRIVAEDEQDRKSISRALTGENRALLRSHGYTLLTEEELQPEESP